MNGAYRAHGFRVQGLWGRGSIYTTIMALGPRRPSPLWFWGTNSIITGYMDPLQNPEDL